MAEQESIRRREVLLWERNTPEVFGNERSTDREGKPFLANLSKQDMSRLRFVRWQLQKEILKSAAQVAKK